MLKDYATRLKEHNDLKNRLRSESCYDNKCHQKVSHCNWCNCVDAQYQTFLKNRKV